MYVVVHLKYWYKMNKYVCDRNPTLNCQAGYDAYVPHTLEMEQYEGWG